MKYASLFFFIPTLAIAQEPPVPTEAKIIVNAPDEARVGELVRFDVSESVADSFKWLLVPDSDDFEVYDSGRRAVFSARLKGNYRFIIACAKDGTVDVITHVVTIIGPPPSPTSDSLAEWIPIWIWEEGLPRDEALTIADNFEKVASQPLVEPEEWIKVTAEANKMALGDRLEAWKPVLDKIGQVLHKRAEQGKLTTPEKHVEVWMEIAKGLRSN